jgi:hypothetical protein
MPPILPSALHSDDDSDYGEYDDYVDYENDDDGGTDYDHRLPVPGGGNRPSSSRIDDLGRDSAAQHGKLSQRSSRPASPFADDSPARPPASNSPVADDSGTSGGRRGGVSSSSSNAVVDPLYVGLTAAIACLLLAVGAVLIALIALRTYRRDGGSGCNCSDRLCRSATLKSAELPLYRYRSGAERHPASAAPATTAAAPTAAPSTIPQLTPTLLPPPYPAHADRSFLVQQQQPLMLLLQPDRAVDEGQSPDVCDQLLPQHQQQQPRRRTLEEQMMMQRCQRETSTCRALLYPQLVARSNWSDDLPESRSHDDEGVAMIA